MNNEVEIQTEAIAETITVDTKKAAKTLKTGAKDLEMEAFKTEDAHYEGMSNGRRISLLEAELKQLERQQEKYRQIVGPKARIVLRTWHAELDKASREFVISLRNQYEDKKLPYLDLASIGAQWYFNKEVISDAPPALAFAVVGDTALKEHDKNETHYYPVVPRIIEIRAELEEFGVTDKTN